MAPSTAESSATEEECTAPAHHPSAPSSELFDVSTTVDPSYIINLIRRLLPNSNHGRRGPGDGGTPVQGSENGDVEKNEGFISSVEAPEVPNNISEAMDTLEELDGLACDEEKDEGLCHGSDHPATSVIQEAWEECGCVLWDLAANRTHAELMVQNLLLEVLLATLNVSPSVRVTEISLGIIANLACHEVPQNRIVSTDGLIETIVNQLFLDDSPCLCEAFRLLTLGLQGSGSVAWAEQLQHEHILCRILWIAENTLNLQLLEKGVELLLAMLDSQQEVAKILLPPLMNLGLPSLLVNLLACEMEKLTGERIPDRYSILDLILRTIEALSVTDNYSQVISLNKELFHLVYGLVKLPDKVEVASSCVTAAVLIANILSDSPDLASEISQDLTFMQGLLDVFPFVSNDSEAQSALWSVLARVLARVQEGEMSTVNLCQYVTILVEKSDVIEEALLEHQLEDAKVDCGRSSPNGIRLNARATVVS